MNKDDRTYIDAKFKDMHERINRHSEKIDTMMDGFEVRVRALEDWKLVFVAKFTVYSAIALFLGSIVAQIGMTILLKYL